MAFLLVFHQAHNLSRSKCARLLANQPISALHFFNPRQMFLLWVKLITQGEKRETSTKACNETMLCNKLRVFVSRISPPSTVRTQSSRASWSAGERPDRLWDNRLHFPRKRGFRSYCACLSLIIQSMFYNMHVLQYACKSTVGKHCISLFEEKSVE